MIMFGNASGEGQTRVLIVGCGQLGSRHLQAVASLPQVRVPVDGPEGEPDEGAQDVAVHEAEPALTGAAARSMPWVISVFFHVGLALILALYRNLCSVEPDEVDTLRW